jgi:DeoR family glycerol-3-phosphate regulon repressor
MLRTVSADVVIMGIRGITAEGISDSNSLIVESIRAMIQAARKVVIVADHSKFGRGAMLHVADLSEIDQIVTDQELAPEFMQLLKENSIECIVAS